MFMLLFLVAQSLTPTRPADPPAFDRAAVEAVVREGMAEHGVLGLALAIRSKDAWVLNAGYGLARLVPPVPATRETRFQIASLTKPLTACVVLALVQGDRLSLDDRARKHLPWLPPALEEITIRQLLNHTSGVAHDLRADNLDDFGAEEFRARLARAAPEFAPGDRFRYANTGYILLGFIVEACTQRPFGDVLEERLLSRIGMSSTAYLSPPSDALLQARGYALEEGRHAEAPYYSGGFTGGGISTSTQDLALWIDALEASRLLAAPALDSMFTPGRLAGGEAVHFSFGGEDASYGMGWFLARRNGRELRTHGGAVSGFSAALDRYVDGDLCVLVLTNAKGPGADAIAKRVADVMLE